MAAPMRGAVRGWQIDRSGLFQVPLDATLLLSAAPPALSAPANLVAPSISGTPETGQTLTRSLGSWSGNPVPSVAWQWTADGADIAGANGATLVLDVSLEGAVIGGHATATNSQGSAGPISSSNTLGPVTAPPSDSPPAISGMDPMIMGTPEVGQTLTRMPGDWSGTPTPTVTWQWTSDGADLVGATDDTLVLGASHLGHMIGGYETADNGVGSPVVATAADVGPVTDPPPANTAPSNIDPPMIMGMAETGQTLTYMAGAWSGNPTPTLSWQWTSDGADIVGETGGSYALTVADEGHIISGYETADNGVGFPVVENANSLGPVLPAGSALSSTDATLVSAPGEDLVVDITMGTDIYPGYYLRIQRTDVSMVGDPTMGDYTTPTMDLMHSLTESERAAEAIPNDDLILDGYTSPTGDVWQRYRWEREDGVVGPWSEVYTTVNASVAVWSGDGDVGSPDKSQWLHNDASLGHLNVYVRVNIGSTSLARASIPSPKPKFHYEVTIEGINSSGALEFGVSDDSADLTVNTQLPGRTVSSVVYPGASIHVTSTGGYTVWANNVSHVGTLPSVAVGDKIAIEVDTTTNQVSYYHWAVADGTVTFIRTDTITGAYVPSQWYAIGGGKQGTLTPVRDNLTANFGAAPFSVPLSAGFELYG